MYNQPWNAQSASEYQKKEYEKEMQPKIQILELQKQSAILVESMQITKENAEIVALILQQNKQNSEYIKHLVECTKQNQISANHQFWASIIIAFTALVISSIQLFK